MNKSQESKVKELIYVFLEDAPTLWGLPIAFLDNDILINKKNGFVYLDFTTSVNLDSIINEIYSNINLEELIDIFEKNKGLDLNTELFKKIRYSYHTGFYNKLHLNAKDKCSRYLISVINKYTRGLSPNQTVKFYKNYKIDKSLYDRGLIDYEYSNLGLSLNDKNLISDLNKTIETLVINFVKQNNILPKDLDKGIKADSKNDIFKVLDKDTENIKYISDRIIKLLNKHKDFYTTDIKQYKNILKYKLPNSNIILPIIKISSLVKNDIIIYITPFSAYIEVPIENSKQIVNVYHIGRHSLKECKNKMELAIKKFKFPSYCISFIDLLYLR